MTTLDPGASVVLTHGLRCRPFSTAFFASSAAPIITDGFEVFVHDVIAAIATAPWSTSNAVPSSSVTDAGLLGRPDACWAAECQSTGAPAPAAWPFPLPFDDGESLAGNDSSDASSSADTTPAGFSCAGTPDLRLSPPVSPAST